MTFQCWVFRRWVLRRWVFRGWVLRPWVFEAYYREYPTRNLKLGIPDVGRSRRWVFQMLGIPYENQNFSIFSFAEMKHKSPTKKWRLQWTFYDFYKLRKTGLKFVDNHFLKH